jgi:hypothetical protein
MNGTITYLAGREHANDLLREAEQRRLGAEVRRPRRVKFTMPRLLIRLAAVRATARRPSRNWS